MMRIAFDFFKRAVGIASSIIGIYLIIILFYQFSYWVLLVLPLAFLFIGLPLLLACLWLEAKLNHKTLQQYQEAVDNEAKKLLAFTPEQIESIEDYGSLESLHNGRKYSIAWWHHTFDDNRLHHVVFMEERRLIFGFHDKFISGVKMLDGRIKLLNDDETGMYD